MKSFSPPIWRGALLAGVAYAALLSPLAQAQTVESVSCPAGAQNCISAPDELSNTSLMSESSLKKLVKTAKRKVELTFTIGSNTVDVADGDRNYKVLVGMDAITKVKELADANSEFVSYKSESKTFSISLGDSIEFGVGLAALVGMGLFIRSKLRGVTAAKMHKQPPPSMRFSDLAGLEEAKQDLQDVVDFFRNPREYTQVRKLRVPRGVLLVGPPGTGKTAIARATAGEARANFYTISGADFAEMFVGVGASRIRSMMEELRRNAPCIIFVDEIDALGRKRGGMGNEEREATLNQFLVEMDGFATEDPDRPVVFIAATNQPEVLDPAMTRPGRFDRQVVCDLPDTAARAAQFRIEFAKKLVAPELLAQVDHYAAITPGFSGASIAGSVNEAGWFAARANRLLISLKDMDDGIQKTDMGSANQAAARRLTPEERQRLAAHEWAHNFVALFLGEKPGRVTILPRGRAGGHFMPYANEAIVHSERVLKNRIAVYMAGLTAEELLFEGEEGLSSGCSNDLHEANRIARAMVGQFGMSPLVGKVSISDEDVQKMVVNNPTSDVALEVKRIVAEGHERARKFITGRWTEFLAGAGELRHRETLLGFEAQQVYDDAKEGRLVPRDDLDSTPFLPRGGDLARSGCKVVPIGRLRRAVDRAALALPQLKLGWLLKKAA